MNRDLCVNTRLFVKRGDLIEGTNSLNDFSRLLEDVPHQETQVRWSIKGLQKGMRDFLSVQVYASPVLICQRCLEPFEYLIESQVMIELVDSEDLLDIVFNEQDLSEKTSEFERMVHQIHFDVLRFIEDELILSIPYIPRHESCIQLEVEEEEKESPFAILEKIKH